MMTAAAMTGRSSRIGVTLRRPRSAFGITANMVYSPITDTGLVTDALTTANVITLR